MTAAPRYPELLRTGLEATVRGYTVDCAEHGAMARDEPRKTWKCPDRDCRAWLPDTEVYRLMSAAPDDTPDPMQIVVT
jgi:hypothetical protein